MIFYTLGVMPSEPGYTGVRIEPHLGRLSQAKGVVPSPHGLIEVEVTPDVLTFTSPVPAIVAFVGRAALELPAGQHQVLVHQNWYLQIDSSLKISAIATVQMGSVMPVQALKVWDTEGGKVKRCVLQKTPANLIKPIKPIKDADWLTGLTTLIGDFEVPFSIGGTS